MGIQSEPRPDPANPIPPDANTGLYPGGYVTNSQLQFVGNNGTGNAISIPLSGLQFTPNTTATASQAINMPFSTVQQAARTKASSTNVVAYDSLGIPAVGPPHGHLAGHHQQLYRVSLVRRLRRQRPGLRRRASPWERGLSASTARATSSPPQ